jgi:hypothetical protein
MRILFFLLAVSVSQAQVNFCEEAVATPKVAGNFEMYQNGFVTVADTSGYFDIYNAEGKKIAREKKFKIYRNGFIATRDETGYSDVYNANGERIITEKEVDIFQGDLVLARSITRIFAIYNAKGEIVATGRTEAQKIRRTKKEPVAKPCSEIKEPPAPARFQHRIR